MHFDNVRPYTRVRDLVGDEVVDSGGEFVAALTAVAWLAGRWTMLDPWVIAELDTDTGWPGTACTSEFAVYSVPLDTVETALYGENIDCDPVAEYITDEAGYFVYEWQVV